MIARDASGYGKTLTPTLSLREREITERYCPAG
jgi:hypothetical protein